MVDQPAVTPTRCYSCITGRHFEFPHTWGTPEDWAEAVATGGPEPGDCMCECGQLAPERAAAFKATVVESLKDAEQRRAEPAVPDDIEELKRRLAECQTAKENADERT